MIKHPFATLMVGLLLMTRIGAQTDARTLRPDDPPLTIEGVLKEATTSLTRETQKIRDRIKQAAGLFGAPQVDAGKVFRREREVLINFGPMAADEVVAVFKTIENRDVLEQLGQVLVPLLETRKAPGAFAEMVQILKSNHAERSRAAALVLGMVRNPSVLEDLRTISRTSKNNPVRAAAMVALAWLNDAEAVSLWHDALKEPSPAIRRGALQAIEKAERSEDYKLVFELLRDNDADVVVAAVQCLGAMKDSSDALKTLLEVARQGEVTQNRTKREAMAALDAIARLNNREPSKKTLRDLAYTERLDSDLRTKAARVLMDMGIDDGLEKLVEERRKRSGRDEPQTRLEVGRLYFEFKRYKPAISELEKALPRLNGSAETTEICDKLARSYARTGNFPKAADYLYKASGDFDWQEFRNDEDFAEFQKDKRWTKNFEGTP